MAHVEIVDKIKELVERYDEDLFLIISPKGHKSIYVQFLLHDEKTLYWEVVSNYFLPADLHLSYDDITKLENMGFKRDDLEPNFCKTIVLKNELTIEQIAKDLLRIFVEIFEVMVTELEITMNS